MDNYYSPELIGYLGLILSIIAISKTNMKSFRVFHLSSSIIYLIYGIYISANPIIIGAIIYAIIHVKQIIKLYNYD